MDKSLDIIKTARNVIEIEYTAIAQLSEKIGVEFVEAVSLILSSDSRLIIAAVGKSANIANKLVATFNSTGQPAIFLHAADAVHGDLGSIQKNDIVICISKSGNTEEIKAIIPLIKNMGNNIIAITGNKQSYLAQEANILLDASVEKEACPHNLAPTSSTTTQLVLGDALAVCLLKCKNFSKEDFARFHPGGVLGKRLRLTVKELLTNRIPCVNIDSDINQVIVEISEKRLGATVVLDKGLIRGIITDGDLRRMLIDGKDISNLKAVDVMNNNPKKVESTSLAYHALKYMKEENISQLVVVNNSNYVGIIHIHDILKEGIVNE
ncbi:MAG: KpsF/GutQ family sugar-phosphate isomerase [Bacteroidota bacterium]|nr:KpsF/GutQ family sugar-phosphate isomerase [Bacteroidota bacterium]